MIEDDDFVPTCNLRFVLREGWLPGGKQRGINRILQQAWQRTTVNGDTVVEWRDVPLETP